MKHTIFDYTADGYTIYTEQDALDIIRGLVWGEIETHYSELPQHSRFFCELEGVACYYDYAGDYYIFVDTTEEGKMPIFLNINSINALYNELTR